MKDALFVAIFTILILEMYIGGLMLCLSFGEFAFKKFWEYLREDYNIIGCILIYLVTAPALLLTILYDIFSEFIIPEISNLFYKIFKKR